MKQVFSNKMLLGGIGLILLASLTAGGFFGFRMLQNPSNSGPDGSNSGAADDCIKTFAADNSKLTFEYDSCVLGEPQANVDRKNCDDTDGTESRLYFAETNIFLDFAIDCPNSYNPAEQFLQKNYKLESKAGLFEAEVYGNDDLSAIYNVSAVSNGETTLTLDTKGFKAGIDSEEFMQSFDNLVSSINYE